MGETTQTRINLDEIADDSHVIVTINGQDHNAVQPSLAMLERLQKSDESSADVIGVLRDFIRSVLPSLTEDQVMSLSLNKAKVLAESVCQELGEGPTEAVQEA